MHPGRIAELLKPYIAPLKSSCHSESSRRLGEACPEPSRREPAVLSAERINAISTYINLLLRWNARVNLTAIRDEDEIVTRHFGESIFAARHLFSDTESSRATVADVGSGAGFPGIPMKIWAPGIVLTLIEANQKKATFLREVVRTLTLTDIDIKNVRAESIAGTFEVVALRAVERFGEILPIALRLVAKPGRLALMISSSQADQARSELPGLIWQETISMPESKSRVLLVGEHVS
jgi:16S rRNA (guanine527-N7)-methyltransferase